MCIRDRPNTGAYQNWVTQGPQQINLEAGEHTMRIEWTESGSNLNWLLFERTGELATEHALTVTFPATVELSVGGESQTIANLLGKYTAKDVYKRQCPGRRQQDHPGGQR